MRSKESCYKSFNGEAEAERKRLRRGSDGERSAVARAASELSSALVFRQEVGNDARD